MGVDVICYYVHTLFPVTLHKKRRLRQRRRQVKPADPEPSAAPEAVSQVIPRTDSTGPKPHTLALRGFEAPGPADLLEHFFGNRSPDTIKAYKRDLVAFAAFVGSTVPAAVTGLLGLGAGQANALILGWVNAMSESGLSAATRRRRLATLRSIARMARTLGMVTWQIEIKGPKAQPYRDTRGPDRGEIHRLFATCGDDLTGRRNEVVLRLLVTLGLRRTELIGLCLKDYDRERRRLHVMGKGRKEVQITVPANCSAALEAWLEIAQITDPEAPLVHSPKYPGKPLARSGLNHIVKRIGKLAGIKVWPHGLRHAAITMGLDRHDHREVQRFSRHASFETVLKYDDNRQDLGARVAQTIDEEFKP